MNRLLSCFVVTALAAAALAIACSDPLIESYCMGIPEGGCPSNQPSTCVHDAGADGESGDPTCAALYTHSPSCVWTLVQTCPGFVRAKDAGRPGDARDAAADARDGCVDLENPDCPLELALACGGHSCCGCQTLYVCNDGGWNPWGQCVDGGVMASPRP